MADIHGVPSPSMQTPASPEILAPEQDLSGVCSAAYSNAQSTSGSPSYVSLGDQESHAVYGE